MLAVFRFVYCFGTDRFDGFGFKEDLNQISSPSLLTDSTTLKRMVGYDTLKQLNITLGIVQ